MAALTGILARTGNIHEWFLYTDKMWVWNIETFHKNRGPDENILSNKGLAENILSDDPFTDKTKARIKARPCRLSKPYEDTTKDSTTKNIPVDWQPQLFYRGVEIKPGEWVEVECANGDRLSGYIAEPTPFDGHYQAYIRRDINA